MNALQIFRFEEQEVRTQIINNEPWFVANDIARTLGYTNPSKATNDHCKKAIKSWGNDSLGRPQEFKFIPEADVFRLIIKSHLPSAEKFENWVMEEVLPTIRKHGAYMTSETIEKALMDPDTIIRLATTLKEEREQRLIAEQRVMELQPKASYYDLILQNKSLISVSSIAKDYGKSAQWLNNKLFELGVQYKQGGTWLLYQKHADKGYTQSTTHIIDDERSKLLTKWTQKGRLAIYAALKEDDILPLIEINQSV